MTDSDDLKSEELLSTLEQNQKRLKIVERNNKTLKKRLRIVSSKCSKKEQRILELEQLNQEQGLSLTAKDEMIASIQTELDQARLKNQELMKERCQVEELEKMISAVEKETAKNESDKKEFQKLQDNLKQEKEEFAARVMRFENDVESESKKRAEIKKRKLESEYDKKENSVKKKYEARKSAYKIWILFSVMYGIVVTLFSAVYSKTLVSDIAMIGLKIGKAVYFVYKMDIKMADVFLDATPLLGSFVVVLILFVEILFTFGSAYFIGRLCYKYLIKHQRDKISLTVLLFDLAVVVFFGKTLRGKVPLNLVLVFILIWILYTGIRVFVIKKWICVRNKKWA